MQQFRRGWVTALTHAEISHGHASLQTFLNATVTELAIKVLAAMVFWIVGRWLIGRVISLMHGAMNRNHVDLPLTQYLGSIIDIALNIALVLGIVGYFGIQTTSFAAMLAGAGGVAAGHQPRGYRDRGASVLPHRPLLAGLLRHERDHGSRR